MKETRTDEFKEETTEAVAEEQRAESIDLDALADLVAEKVIRALKPETEEEETEEQTEETETTEEPEETEETETTEEVEQKEENRSIDYSAFEERLAKLTK